MQIRTQGRRVQLIRTKYDPSKKRNVSLPVLSFSPFEQPSDAIWRELGETEAQQLRDWIAQRDAEARRVRIAYTASTVAARIQEVTDAVPQMRPEAAAEVWQALDALRRALTKAGHRRPAKTKATTATPEPDQA